MEKRPSYFFTFGILFMVLIQTSFSQNVTTWGVSSRATDPVLKGRLTKTHGSCFVLAWLFFITVAIMCARYFKSHWSQHTIFGLQIWFHVHKTFNLIAAALMIVGMVTILIAHEWRWTGPRIGGGARNYSIASYHSIFGIFAVIFAWLQPFIALLRCGKDAPARLYFNWLHRALGMVAWVFAIASTVLACCNFTKRVTSVHDATIAICIFMAGTLIAFIVGDMLLILLQSKLTKPNTDNKQPSLLPSVSIKMIKCLMTTIGALYVCLTAAVSIALLCFIILK